MIKKFALSILAAALLFTLCTAYAAIPEFDYWDDYNYYEEERPFDLHINGEYVEFESPIRSIDDVTYAQTDILAEKLQIDAAELESNDIDGVMMSPIRASADKKGWTTYWTAWNKTIIIIDTETLRNDFKNATSDILLALKKILVLPENGEYNFNTTFSVKADGGDNGFNLYTKADAVGSIKLDKNKISGNFNINYEGIHRLIWMITSGSLQMPYEPLDFKFYIDATGIYVKSPLASKIAMSSYYVPEEYRISNANKWIKIEYSDIEMDDLDAFNKIRNFDKDYVTDCIVNLLIFDEISPDKAYVSTYTYKSWKSYVDTVVKLDLNKLITFENNLVIAEVTAKDLQWRFETLKENITNDEYYVKERDESTIILLDRFIQSISGDCKTICTFQNDLTESINTLVGMKMEIPFYFDQTISKLEFLGEQSIKTKDIGTTEITETAPEDYITQKQIWESNKYRY